MDETAAIAAFGELDIFAGFSDEHLRLLAFVAEDVTLRPGEILYNAGDTAGGAYVLVSGVLEASYPESGGGGRFRIEPVALVGELGLMLARPRAATIMAARTSFALFLPREPFLKLLHNHPELAADVAQTLRGELSRYLETIARLGSRFTE